MKTHCMHRLPFFPVLLPDESLHSLISRYHRLSGNPEERHTLHDAFGTHLLVATANLPSHLPTFAPRCLNMRHGHWIGYSTRAHCCLTSAHFSRSGRSRPVAKP